MEDRLDNTDYWVCGIAAVVLAIAIAVACIFGGAP